MLPHKSTANRNQYISTPSKPLWGIQNRRGNTAFLCSPHRHPTEIRRLSSAVGDSPPLSCQLSSFFRLFLNGVGNPNCYWKISQEHVAGSTWILPTLTGPRLVAGVLVLGPHDPPYAEGKDWRKLHLWRNRLIVFCLEAFPLGYKQVKSQQCPSTGY